MTADFDADTELLGIIDCNDGHCPIKVEVDPRDIWLIQEEGADHTDVVGMSKRELFELVKICLPELMKMINEEDI